MRACWIRPLRFVGYVQGCQGKSVTIACHQQFVRVNLEQFCKHIFIDIILLPAGKWHQDVRVGDA